MAGTWAFNICRSISRINSASEKQLRLLHLLSWLMLQNETKERLPTGMVGIRREINPSFLMTMSMALVSRSPLASPFSKEPASSPSSPDCAVIHLAVDTPELGSQTLSPEGMKPQAPRAGPRPWRRPWPRSSNPG